MPQFMMPGKEAPEFADLDQFTQGYVEAMFWTESCHGDDFTMARWHDADTQEEIADGSADGNIPSDAGFTDLHPDAIADIIADCVAFQKAAAAPLAIAYAGDYSADQAGHDFWLTRNGHGTGFWDRDALNGDGVAGVDGTLGRQLTAFAKEAGEPQVWFADHVQYGSEPFVYHS